LEFCDRYDYVVDGGFLLVGCVDEKVVDLEAQRRAEELQAAKEKLDASAMLQQQQQQQPNFASREGTATPVGPS